MTDNIVSFDFNGVKILRDANTKLVRLTVPTKILVNRTFHDSSNNSDYQVPSGKKATIIYVEKWDIGGFTSTIGYADNVDGNTNAVDLWDPGVASLMTNLLFLSAEIPALKYINFIMKSGSTQDEIICYAIEENA